MKAFFMLLITLVAGVVQAQSPSFVWAKRMGGTSGDVGTSVVVDGAGNVYTTGYFRGTVDFNPGAGTFNLTASGSSSDIFVSKLNASGAFVWAKKIGGTADDAGISIKVDNAGNVYTTGYFRSTADFDPGAGTFNLTAGASSSDIFISKLSSAGGFVWAKRMGGITNDLGASIALDCSGNIYTTGYFTGTADFDPGAGTFNLTAGGVSDDIFVSKLNSSGAFIWARKIGGIEDDYGISISVDCSGNVYTTGYFSGTTDFDPGAGTANLTSAGNFDIFISKLSSSGSFVWARKMGGTTDDVGLSIKVDGSGNVYTTGYFKGMVDFNPGTGTFNLTASGSSSDIFVSKLNSSGVFVWAKRIGGTAEDLSVSIAVDGLGNVYTTGYFKGMVDFNPGSGTFNLTARGSSSDIFVSKLNASGAFIWARQMGGTTDDGGLSITIDGSGNIYTTGYFTGTADFDPGTGTFNLTAAGSFSDIFVEKLNESGSLPNSMVRADDNITNIEVTNNEEIQKGLYIFPNPVLDVLNVQARGVNETATVQIIDVFGRIVKQEIKILNYNTFFSIDVKSLQKGTYFLVLYRNDNKEVQVFTKQ